MKRRSRAMFRTSSAILSEAEIEMLWSGNFLRVMDEVQRVATEIQAGG